jgi:sec-independent protein translocase protein TatB
MNFIGIGYGEILIIIVAALIIFGPDKLPEVAGQAARWLRDARKMMTEMSGEFERSAGMKEFKEAIEGEIKGVKKELEDAGISVKNDLSKAAGSANAAVAGAASAARGSKPTGTAKTTTAATGTKPGTATATKPAGKPKASKLDPYAGLVQLTEASPKKQRAAAIIAEPIANGNGSGNGSTAPIRETSEAVMRARERRLAAGYNRRNSTP